MDFCASQLRRLREDSGNRTANEADGDDADYYQAEISMNFYCPAIIHTPEGKEIGMLDVPSQFFNMMSERSGEFVLLSSNAEKKASGRCAKASGRLDCGAIKHVHECEHIQSRNIMLIESHGNIAYRRAIAEVWKEDWTYVTTQIKTIILG